MTLDDCVVTFRMQNATNPRDAEDLRRFAIDLGADFDKVTIDNWNNVTVVSSFALLSEVMSRHFRDEPPFDLVKGIELLGVKCKCAVKE